MGKIRENTGDLYKFFATSMSQLKRENLLMWLVQQGLLNATAERCYTFTKERNLLTRCLWCPLHSECNWNLPLRPLSWVLP